MFGAFHCPLPLFVQPASANSGVADLLSAQRSTINLVSSGAIRVLVADSALRSIVTATGQTVTLANGGQPLESR